MRFIQNIWIISVAVILLSVNSYAGYAIVNNNGGGGTQEDSITVTFIVTDTINNIATADSFLVAIFNPTGDSVYAASYTLSASEISSILIGSRRFYRWTEAVADIDAGGEIGSYTGFIIGIDTLDGTGSDYLESHVQFSFQLEPTFIDTIETILAEVGGVNGLTPVQVTDNIGINWGDVTNQATSVNLSATTTNLVNTATAVTNDVGLTATAIDNIWDEDSTGHYTSPNMAFLAAQTGASSGISDADMVSIIDTLLNKAASDTIAASIHAKILRDASAASAQAIANNTGITEILDTLKTYDNAGRFQADVQEVLDTLQTYDNINRFQDDITDLKRVLFAKLGIVNSGATTTTLTSSTLVEADGYWKDQIITFITGDAINQSARIINFTTASNTITMSPALSVAPVFNDSFVIYGFSGININSSGRYLSATLAGQVGINLDNTNGSLSDSEVDEIGVKVTSMAPDVLTSSAIASSGAAEFSDSVWYKDTTDALFEFQTLRVLGNAAAASEENRDTLQNQDNWIAKEASLITVDEIWEYDSANVSGAQAMGTMLKDTSAYQGSASSLTNASIATAVKDTASNNASIFYGPTASGTGTDTVSFYAIDTSGTDTALSDVKITVKNPGGSTVAVNTTDATGLISFYLDAGTYTMIGKQSPNSPAMHLFDSRSLTVSGNSTDSLFGYDLVIGASSVPGLCRVYGYLFTSNGLAEKDAEVKASLPDGVVRTSGSIISPFGITSTTDSVGYFYLDLIPSDSLIPTSTKYEISISRSDGSILRKRISVPDLSSWKLTW